MSNEPKNDVDSDAETVATGGTSDLGAGGRVPPDFERGAVVGGRYRIDSFLAAGGMGHVYRAHDLFLDVPIAVKTIRPEIASNPASLRRFKQEVLLARSVTHSNVCRIFDLQRDDATGVSFLTMEYLRGETLSSRIETSGAIPPGSALPLVRQMAEALDTAHRAGIVHRDFKSQNVMLVPDNGADRAVITDFGLAVMLDSSAPSRAEPTENSPPIEPSERATVAASGISEAGALVGTPAYMSPEQVRGGAVGPLSDLYALGVVLYEMCTGRLPFRGATPIDTARAHLAAEPPSPRALVDVDDAWERTIMRLLAKKPSDRFATAHDVVRALEGGSDETTTTPCQLPAELDAFVGRTSELEAIASRLEGLGGRSSTRLLTLQGPGGTGKTRLALKYGWEKRSIWPGGVWFCDASEARSAEGVMAAVAQSLNVTLGKDDPVVQLGHAIAARGRCLLILDNLEQVVGHARAMLGRWIEGAPEASFLATSRERLQLPREAVFDLAPLDPASEGVELFEVRAQAYRAGFAIDDTNRARVKAIVRSLDGLPLAIELAASRLRMLTLEQLATRLQDRFKVLAGGRHGRHATLRATLDWSWELLEPLERSAVAQLSIFEGGFTLEAAEAVIDLSTFEEDPLVLDVIQSLVDKSWLRAKVVQGSPRFEMYVMVQEYAYDKLVGEGSSGDGKATPPPASLRAVESRHGAYYAQMGSNAAIESLDRHGGVEKRATLRLELDNLVAACHRAIGRRDEAVAVAAFAAASHVFQLRGPLAASIALGHEVIDGLRDPVLRGRALMDLAVAERFGARTEDAGGHFEAARRIFVAAGDRRSEGIVLTHLGILLGHLGRMAEAREHYEAAVAIHRGLGDRRHLGSALGNLGTLHWHQGRMAEAREHYETSLAIHREVGNRSSEGIILGNLGSLHMGQGRMAEARAHFEAALVILREVGNRWMEAVVLSNLGGIDHEQGRLHEAREKFETALAIHRDMGQRGDAGVVLGNLGGLHQEQQRIEEARECLEAALAIHREGGNRRFEGFVLGDLGELCRAQGLIAEALSHGEKALAIHRELGNRRGQGIALRNLGEVDREQGRIEEARVRFEESLGLLRDVGDRLEVALTLCSVSELECVYDLAAAHTTLDGAESLAQELFVEPSSPLARRIVRVRQALARAC